MTVTVRDVRAFKERGERFAMLTAYDVPTASILDEAGIPVLLVGDSLAQNVLGLRDDPARDDGGDAPPHPAVARGRDERADRRRHAVPVVPDLPRGRDPQRRPLPEGGRRARRQDRGRRWIALAHALVDRGIPVMGHLGLTPAVRARDGRLPRPGQDRSTTLSGCWSRPSTCRRPARSRSSSKGIPSEARRPDHATPSTSPRSGSAPGRTATARCWCSPTCSASAPGRTRSSPRRTRTCVRRSRARSTAFRDDVAAGTFPDDAHSYH